MISRSNKAAGVGLVQHEPATSGSQRGLQRGKIDAAFLRGADASTAKPQSAAVAGLVPWADSGTRIRVRFSAARVKRRPDREDAA
jgi:hypothetical protein